MSTFLDNLEVSKLLVMQNSIDLTILCQKTKLFKTLSSSFRISRQILNFRFSLVNSANFDLPRQFGGFQTLSYDF